MATPIISNYSVAMGNYNNYPIVTISFQLQHDDGLNCEIASSGFQYAYASAPETWYNATLSSSTSGTGLESYVSSPGKTNTLRWDVKTDADNKNENIIFRINVKDSNEVESGYSTSSNVAIKTTSPTVSFALNEYTNQLTLPFTPTTAGSASYYKVAEQASLSGAAWVAYTPDEEINLTFSSSLEGTKNVYLQVRDTYYNTSTIESDSIVLHTTAPESAFLRINGSIPDNHHYTGIKINSDGTMIADRTVTLDLFVEDLLDVQAYIDGDISGDDVGVWFDYKKNGEVVKNTVSATLSGSDSNYDNDASVSVAYKDEAGNSSVVVKTIRLNTKIFKMHNTLIREPNAEYNHQVLKVTQAGTTTLVNETRSLTDEYIRKWSEIFYPTSHDYPRNADGTINESGCISMAETSNASYDAVDLDGGEVNYDDQERPITIDWTKDGTKNYQNLESSYVGNLKYWIIDNEGYGDIELVFEHFYLDANSYGPPFNKIAPYTGDHLVIYDASADGATQEIIDGTGSTSFTLLDSTKLTELYAYTGQGNQVIELSSGYSVNADTNGGFSVPAIRGTERVCLILYTDAASTASGFKLKAGDKHSTVFRNYDIDETNGRLWLHEYPNGQSYSNDIRMIYDYYDTDVNVNLDEGIATFAADPSGVVTADYSYYVKDENKIAEDYSRLFIASQDDFVDYLTPGIYATPSGQVLNKAVNWNILDAEPSGKISSNYTVDKDRGLVEFYSGVGDGEDEYYYVPEHSRIVLDYFYHTYKRLSNDGYGVLTFKDETIVADDTPLFPDYTFVDVKLVNEGDAILENGRLTFLSRGFDNDSDQIIDQVLDVNRPWDVQEGTAAETYDKAAMQVSQNYTFTLSPDKTAARSILSNWKDASFGFDFYPRSTAYGRVVWVIGGASTGSAYPSTSIGRKTFSCELAGKYYNVSV